MHQLKRHSQRDRAGRILNRIFVLSLTLALIWSSYPLLASAQPDDWRPALPGVTGIDYRLFYGVEGMNAQDPIHVARMDRSQPSLTLESLIAGGNIAINLDPASLNLWTGAGVQPTALQIDGAINFWGDLGSPGGQPYWGNTSQVVVAINGGLHNTSTFIPAQGQVQGGWFAWQFDPGENRSGFGWNTAKQAFVGNCIYETGTRYGVIPDLTNIQEYWGVETVNYPRSAERIHIYTPQWGLSADRTWPDEYRYSVEVLVQLNEPLQLGKNFGEYTLDDLNIGRVIDKRVADRNAAFPENTIQPFKMGFDQIVLSGYGTAAGRLYNELDIGDPDDLSDGQEIGINLYLQDGLVGNCTVPSGLSWTDTYTAIGADRTLVANGVRINHDSTPAPRTVIAYNDEYLYFVVAEGHAIVEEQDDGGYNYLGRTGITFNDLSDFMIDQLGAQWAVNLDGGGSSAMVIGGINRVHTTDLYYCPQYFASSSLCPNCQPPANQRAPLAPAVFEAWNQSPALEQVTAIEDRQADEAVTIDYSLGSGTGLCQRRIPNGLAMVAVQPMKTSTRFAPVEGAVAFQVLRGLQVRQGPGRNYPLLAYVPYNPAAPALGLVIPHSNHLDGVYATGSYWWYVEINGQRGWVDQAQITDSLPISVSSPAEGP